MAFLLNGNSHIKIEKLGGGVAVSHAYTSASFKLLI